MMKVREVLLVLTVMDLLGNPVTPTKVINAHQRQKKAWKELNKRIKRAKRKQNSKKNKR